MVALLFLRHRRQGPASDRLPSPLPGPRSSLVSRGSPRHFVWVSAGPPLLREAFPSHHIHNSTRFWLARTQCILFTGLCRTHQLRLQLHVIC